MLLVAAIVLMTTLVAAPSLMRSFRGARLRASVRTLVTAHRQARALAALRQEQHALIVDTVNGRVELVAVRKPGAEPGGPADDGGPGGVQIETEWIRWMSDRIRIAAFHVDSPGQEQEGIRWVRYYPGGVSDRFEATLADEQDRTAVVKTDPVTGRIEASHE